MKTASRFVIFSLAALFGFGAHSASAQVESEWTIDPDRFRTGTRASMKSPCTVLCMKTERGSNAAGCSPRAGCSPGLAIFYVPVGATVPEEAYGKLPVSASAWLAYQQLGPHALANFRLVTEIPIDVSGRWHFEVALAECAQGNVGVVANLSSRADTTPATPLVGGFVVEDVSRTVLIRAIGPGLRQFGVENALTDSRLQLLRSGGSEAPILTNDDWSMNPSHETVVARATARVGAFPLATGSKDAATVITLPPGAYTVHANGVGNGAVLLEVYMLK